MPSCPQNKFKFDFILSKGMPERMLMRASNAAVHKDSPFCNNGMHTDKMLYKGIN